MTAISWSVKIGTIASPTDFSSRVAGLSIDQPLDLQRPSAHTAYITLLNNDGALTPADAGGTGTYASTDWFAQAVFIDATVNSTVPVFHGIVDGFQLQDDGVTSTVTLSVVDGITIAGRAPGGNWSWAQTDNRLAAVIPYAFQILNSYTPNPLNLLGETDAVVVGTECSAGGVTIRTLEPSNSSTVADYVATNIMSSGLSWAWATKIEVVTILGDDLAGYRLNAVGDNLNRTDADAHAFQFVDAKESQGATDVVFESLEVGFLSDRLVNWVELTSEVTTNTRSFVNSESVAKYGAAQYVASNTMIRYDDDVQTLTGIRSGSQSSAENIANRLGSIRFTPLLLTVNGKRLESTSTDSEIEALLDVRSGLWNQATVVRTPTGGAKITDISMIAGRRFDVTPESFMLELSLVPAVDYQTFTLDDSSFGVLDQNRLGLDADI